MEDASKKYGEEHLNQASYALALMEINRLGYQIWLDGFGKGESFLTTFMKYDIRGVKLDPSYFADPSDEKSLDVIRKLIDLNRESGRILIAEGIENREQLANARSFGANLIQGYYYSKPQPIGELIENPLFTQREDEVNVEYYHTISGVRMPSMYRPYYHLKANVPMIYAKAVIELPDEKLADAIDVKKSDGTAIMESSGPASDRENLENSASEKNHALQIRVLRANERMQELLQKLSLAEFEANRCYMIENTDLSAPIRKAVRAIGPDSASFDFNLKLDREIYHCQIAWLKKNPEKKLKAYILNITNFELRTTDELRVDEAFEPMYRMK